MAKRYYAFEFQGEEGETVGLPNRYNGFYSIAGTLHVFEKPAEIINFLEDISLKMKRRVLTKDIHTKYFAGLSLDEVESLKDKIYIKKYFKAKG